MIIIHFFIFLRSTFSKKKVKAFSNYVYLKVMNITPTGNGANPVCIDVRNFANLQISKLHGPLSKKS